MSGAPREEQADGRTARLTALRHELYRVGATERDVQRFLAEQAALTADAAAEPSVPVAPPPLRRSVRRRVVRVVVVLTAATAVLALVQQARPSMRIEPIPTAVPEVAALRDVGEGEVLDLRRGSASRAVPVAASVRGVAAVGQRFEGRGSAIVRFAPPPGSTDGGRAQVTLTAGGSAPVRWRALLLVEQVDRTFSALVMARGVSDGGIGSGEPVTFVYPNRPPNEVAVLAQEGMRWTLEVAATAGIEPVLR